MKVILDHEQLQDIVSDYIEKIFPDQSVADVKFNSRKGGSVDVEIELKTNKIEKEGK